MRWKERPNEAQWSKSTARRSFSTSLAAQAAPGPVADALAPGLEVMEAGGEQEGDGRPEDQVVEVALGVLEDPVPLLVVDDLALARVEHPSGARVDEDHARAAEVAAEAPAGAGPGRRGVGRELAQLRVAWTLPRTRR